MASERECRARFEAGILAELDAVYAVAVQLAGPGAEAEDLTQETFARAFAAWDRFTPGSCPRAWLLGILRHQFLRRQRDEGRHPVVELDDELPAPAEEPRPDWTAVTAELLEAALAEVPLKYREPVILRDLQGLSYRELAWVLELPPGTAMSRLHRGREALRRALLRRGQGRDAVSLPSRPRRMR